jgi:autotransporter-associated beta strand protein
MPRFLRLLPLLAVALTAGSAAAQNPPANNWLPTAFGNYNWNDPANWSNGVPDNSTFSNYVVFTGATGAQNVSVNIPANVLWMDVGSPNATYFLGPSGTGNGLTFIYNQSSQNPLFPTVNVLANSQSVSLYGLKLMGQVTFNQNSTAGTLTLASYDGNPLGSGSFSPVVINGAGTTAMDLGANIGAITKNDAGRLLMVAANGPPTGVGAVAVNGGTMEMNVSRLFPSNGQAGYFASGRAFAVNANGALLLNGNWVTGDGYQNSYAVNGGRIGGTAQFNYLNDLTMTGGRIDAAGVRAGFYGTSGTNAPAWTTNAAATTAEIASQIDLVNGSGSSGNTAGLRITVADGSAAVDLLISGVIRNENGATSGVGTGTFTKLGPGTLQLSNANTYTGGTSLQAGTLLVTNTSGSATGPGFVLGNGTSVIAGTGRIAGFVRLSGGGTTAPAISPGVGGVGTLTVDNSVTLFEDARLLIDVSGTTADKLSLTGTNPTHTFSMGARVALVLSGTFDPNTTYTIAEFGSLSGTFNTVTGLPASHQLTYGPNSITLTPVPVPEPATVLAVAAVGLAGFVVRRKISSVPVSH